ncbi:uL15m family ribosomal protein [Nanoarchaeota archaeon]
MVVKRNKRSRLRGSKSAGHGAKKKGRGSGSRGGVGMAGTGKKAGQKLSYVMMKMPKYLGKKGFIRHGTKKISLKPINLGDINLKLAKFEKEGVAKKTTGGFELNLSKYKVLAKGDLNQKMIITAGSFSKQAKKKIEAKGGKALQK